MALPIPTGDRFSVLFPRPGRTVESTYSANPVMAEVPSAWGKHCSGFVSALGAARAIESEYISQAPGALILTVSGALISSGPEGGPFTPTYQAFEITNTGASPAAWEMSTTHDWTTNLPNLQSICQGIVPPGGTGTGRIELNAKADLLAAGVHTDSAVFRNTTPGPANGIFATTPFQLTVTGSGPGVLAVSPLEDFVLTGDEGGPFLPSSKDYLLSNTGSADLDWRLDVVDTGFVATYGTPPFGPPSVLSGTLTPGASVGVTVWATAALSTYYPGHYVEDMEFANVTTPLGTILQSTDLTVTTPAVITFVSSKISGASLVGYGEYATPSSPPKKYRVRTFTGGLTYCQYNGGAICSAPSNGAVVRSYSGACTYDVSTGAFSSTALATWDTHYVSGTCSGGGTISHPGWSDCTIPSTYDIYDSGLNYVNLTPTTREIIGFGLCATVGGGFGYKSTGSATETLTGEDTDADAIARLLATGTWSGYGPFVADESFISSWGTRTTFDVPYTKVMWGANVTDGLPSTLYSFSADVYESPVGAGDWTYHSSVSASATTDGTGFAEVLDQPVPLAEGFDYVLRSPFGAPV